MAYYEQNREREVERMRRSYAENRKERIAAVRQWMKDNPYKVLDIQRKRRAVKIGVDADDISRQLVFERDEGICGICNEVVDPDDWHLDHIVPLAKGGPHIYENVQVSHPSCNLHKSAKLPGQLTAA